MRFSVNGGNNSLDPLGNPKDPLDPLNNKKKKKDKAKAEFNQEIQLDPFGGRAPRKPRTINLEKKDIPSDTKEIDNIKSKLNLEKDSKLEEAVQKAQDRIAKKKEKIKQKKSLNVNTKKVVLGAVCITIALLTIALFGNKIRQEIQEIKEGTYIQDSLTMLPNITGYTEKDGLEVLDSLGIRYQVQYMFNQFFENGTIIKCSIDPQNPVPKGTILKVYVCKDDSAEEVPEGEDFFKDITLPTCPISKNLIELESVSLDDVNLTLTFKNKSSRVVDNITYILGYYDVNGFKFTNGTYFIADLNLQPGETVQDTIKLSNVKINSISYEYAEPIYVQEF